MKKTAYVLLALILIAMMLDVEKPAYAASQDECAIWLCLPGGFPQGCSAAHNAMIKRIKKRKPPLPSFGSCSEGGSGNYKLGVEYFEPCKDGFDFVKVESNSNKLKGICINNHPKCEAVRNGNAGYVPPELDCTTYNAVLRPKPNFIEMWVSGDYLGKFFYQ